MHLNESSIEAYLTCSKPTVFAMDYLESDIAATATLRCSQVVTISCYRTGVHEFLLFELCSMGKTFWMRFDRMPGSIRRKALFWSSKRWPAEDLYSMNYNRNTLLAVEDKMPKLIELLSGISTKLSMYHISELMTVVRDVSATWALQGTNCRWFCAVTLDSLQRHFGGMWMVSALHSGIAQCRGFDNPATKKVEEIYRPKYLNTAFQAINSVSMAIVDVYPGGEADSSDPYYLTCSYPESSKSVSRPPSYRPTRAKKRHVISQPLSSPLTQDFGPKGQEADFDYQATIFGRVSATVEEPAINDIISISPESMAELFKYMEIEIRSKYLESEIIGLYALHCNPTDSQFGQYLAPFSEILAMWIKSSVIFAKDVGIRAKLVKHFVKVAKQSCKRHNYATTLSIVGALSEIEIRKITTTFGIVGEKTVAQIEKIRVESNRHVKQVPIHARAVLPLKSSAMTARFDALRSGPHASLEANDMVDKLCPREVLETHRMRAEPMEASLKGCYSLLLAAMKSTAQKWDRSMFSARLATLHRAPQIDRIPRL